MSAVKPATELSGFATICPNQAPQRWAYYTATGGDIAPATHSPARTPHMQVFYRNRLQIRDPRGREHSRHAASASASQPSTPEASRPLAADPMATRKREVVSTRAPNSAGSLRTAHREALPLLGARHKAHDRQRKNAAVSPASVRISRLSPVGVTHNQTRRSMVYMVSREGVCRSYPRVGGARGGSNRNRATAGSRLEHDSERRLGPDFDATPRSTHHSSLTVANMSKSHGKTCSSSQSGGYICLDAYPTNDRCFSARTRGIIA